MAPQQKTRETRPFLRRQAMTVHREPLCKKAHMEYVCTSVNVCAQERHQTMCIHVCIYNCVAQHGLDPLRILQILPQHAPAPSREQVLRLPTQPGSCSDVTQRANRRGCTPPELCRCHAQWLAPAQHTAWVPHSWSAHTFQQ